MKHDVLFENYRGTRKFIGKADTLQQAMDVIRDFLIETKFKYYYSRFWGMTDPMLGKCIKVDVGSYDEFFYITNADKFDISETGVL